MKAETPEEFWYQNLAKYHTPPDPIAPFPTNVYIRCLAKMKCREICIFKGHFKNGDNLILTYPCNSIIDGHLMIKNFIGMGVGQSEYESENNVVVYPLDYNKPMDDDFFFHFLETSHGWEINDYGDLSGY